MLEAFGAGWGEFRAEIEEIYDESSLQEGAALAIYAEMSSGSKIGSDRAGQPGRSSESIGRYVADQLIIYAGLAEGTTRYLVPSITEHVETNLWLIEKFLGSKTNAWGNLIEIEGIGFVH